MLNGVPSARAAKRSRELLALVGLADKIGNRPYQLSGGEQQRVAIAVALANQPSLLLADEPTGEVDSQTAQEIIAMLRQINETLGQTIILVTHDIAVAARVDRTLAIRDGRTSTETIRRTPETVAPEVPVESSPAENESRRNGHSLVALLPQLTQLLQSNQLDRQLALHLVDNHLELWPVGSEPASVRQSASGGTSSVIGLSLDSHRELVLVDHAGRLQLPKEAQDIIPTNGRAEVQIAGDRVILWPFHNSK
jgi:ABC-type glutathione transport system ATPase component